MESKDLAQAIQNVLDAKKAEDIEVIEVFTKTVLADYFVIAGGTSITHNKALCDDVIHRIKEAFSTTPGHVEGYGSGRWILIDYKDVVVHLLHPEEREQYSLEKLWHARPGDIESLTVAP